jgi:uncharacterized membrane protein YadS
MRLSKEAFVRIVLGLALAVLIAALGVRTSMQALVHSGWRPVLLMVAETVWLAGLVLAWVLLGTAR